MATRFVAQAVPTRDADRIAPRLVVAVLVLAGLAGLVLRLRNLGSMPLVGDEAIQALAVRAVLEHGIPLLDTGYVYTRSLLYTCISAGLVLLTGTAPDEFGLRLAPALLGTLVILPVYALARQLFGVRVALLSAVFIAISCWEIELSRYARFYTLYQLAFVTAVWCFYRGFLTGRRGWRVWFLLACAVAFLSHHMALLLFTLFAIPLVDRERARPGLLIGWGAAVAVLWYLQKQLVRHVGDMGRSFDASPEPAEWLSPDAGSWSLPDLGLPALYLPDWTPWMDRAAQAPWQVSLPLLVAGAVTGLLMLRRARDWHWLRALLTGLAIMLAAVYQVGLALLMLFVQFMWASPDWHGWRRERLLLSGLATVLLLAGYWGVLLAGAPGGWKALLLTLFGVPNILQHFVYWFALGWPFAGAVAAFTAGVMLLRNPGDRHDPAVWLLPLAVLLPALAASFFKAYFESRYVFHLLPLLVILYSLAVVTLADRLAGRPAFLPGLPRPVWQSGVVLLALLASQDAVPWQAWQIADRDFRSARNPVHSVISWPLYAGFHADRAQPAAYVRQHRQPGERVLVLGPVFMQTQFHYYAGAVDAVLNPSDDPRAYGRWRDGRLVHYLIGAEILDGYDRGRLQSWLAKGGAATWILGDSLLLADENGYYDNDVRSYLRALADMPVVTGRDGYSFALRIPSGQAEEQD